MEFPLKGVDYLLLWNPPPCISDDVVELLRNSCNQRTDLTHIIVLPTVMTYKWINNMFKTYYFSFYVDIGPSYWPSNMNESLLNGIYLPLMHCSPWTPRRSKSVLEVDRKLCLMRIEKQCLKAFFCANISHSHGIYQACQIVLCGSCYLKVTSDIFKVNELMNERGNFLYGFKLMLLDKRLKEMELT